MKQEVSLKKVIEDAESNFRGGFFCCEALVSAIRDNFAPELPKEVIAMASGMAVGAGHSGCMCGALNGGIMALGMFFGRTEQEGPKDPKAVKCMELTHELHDWFRKANGKNSVCCRVLTKEFDMGKGEHKSQCIYFTGLCAGKVAEILIREFDLTNIDEEPAEVVLEEKINGKY
ncbi:C-GCAxxG-C-C family protein [Velocimicrobium porci]|mgnify:CR=1 FL=1|uniref:C_GCAxxG_C_C family protein n=1 Tax=Velocimicrobium porci TaxID=2606634 RepID=A0A6L5Y1W9_9FIRM|nr:C-GCAxxG-C-C family protein [Velocimicrobium porci]MSS64992.1 C_GCAxxG_C_C family protein [Velocimicrobium porci]